jgi:hypothetical protein
MNRFTQKSQEDLIVTTHEIEPLISKDPIITPVLWIVHSMLPDITCCILEALIGGRE